MRPYTIALLSMMLGCGLTAQQAKTIEKGVLSAAQIACVFSSQLTTAPALVEACQIDQQLTPLVNDLIGQREAARKSGVQWHAGS